jgi:hypothetical protein
MNCKDDLIELNNYLSDGWIVRHITKAEDVAISIVDYILEKNIN